MKKAASLILCICMIFAFAAECFAFKVQVKKDDGNYIEIDAYSDDTVSYIRSVVAAALKVRSSRVVIYQKAVKLDPNDTLGEHGMDKKDELYILSYNLLPESSSSSSSSKSSSSSSSRRSSSSSSKRVPVTIVDLKEENPNTGANVYGSAIVALAVVAGAAILLKKKR